MTTSKTLADALRAIGLDAYVAAFEAAGYQDVQDLGATDEEATTAIKAIIPTDKPGVVNRIKALWAAATTKAPEPVATTREAREFPKLPAGTKLDLTQSTFSFDDVTYAVPTGLQVSSSEKDFGQADWLAIAKKTKILYGVNLERAYSDPSNARATRAALLWLVPANDDYLDLREEGHSDSSLAYTARTGNLVRSHIVEGSVSIGTPFVSVAAEASREEKQSKSSQKKRLYMTGLWLYKRATLTLRDCTVASPAFIQAIDAALDESKSKAQQFEALRLVFNDYGHAVPEEVTLGGKLYFSSERDASGSVEEGEVKSTIKAAVDAKYGGVAAAASASYSDGEGHKVQAQDIAERTAFDAIGGDTTLATTPSAWAPTVKDPMHWDVIVRKGMRPLIKWLDDSRASRVTAVWDWGIAQAWTGGVIPKDYLLPEFEGKTFTIATCPAPGAYKDYLYAPGVVKGGDRLAIKPRSLTAVKDFVIGVTGNLLSDPTANGLLWRLAYSGATTGAVGVGTGKPIYFIVSASGDTPLALARIQVGTGGGMVDCAMVVQIKDPKALAPGGVRSPATAELGWTITPADPGGTLGPNYAGTYLIEHVATGKLLGPVKTNTSQDLIHPPGAPPLYLMLEQLASKVTTEKLDFYSWVLTKQL